MRAGFFTNVRDKSALERVEFYQQDIRILRDLGFDLTIATRWKEIPLNVDFYFVWWWQWAFLPMLKSILHRRPCLVTGVFDYRWPSGTDYLHRPSWQKWLMRYALKNASASVFLSQVECKEVSRDLTVKNPVYIPTTVDAAVYCEGSQPREDFTLTVAWTDKINSWRKCVPELIQAAPLILARHPEMRFIIAGEKGSDYPRLAEMAEEPGDRGPIPLTADPGLIG